MAISDRQIKLIDRASLIASCVGVVLAGLTQQSLFVLTPLSINIFSGWLRRERLEQKYRARRHVNPSVAGNEDLHAIELKLQRMERKIAGDRANISAKIANIERLATARDLNDLTGKVSSRSNREIDKKIDARTAEIESLLESTYRDRMSPIESKIKEIEKLIYSLHSDKIDADAKLNLVAERLSFVSNVSSLLSKIDSKSDIDRTAIDLKINLINERLSSIPEVDTLDRIANNLFQKQREILQVFTNELRADRLELLSGRKESRQRFVRALQEAKTRLILVCPWINDRVLNSYDDRGVQIKNTIETALQRNVKIDIGWGHFGDLDDRELSAENLLNLTTDRQQWKYSGIAPLQELAAKYTNLQLKVLGTHEKYLVCDGEYAMVGSHNFLTSGGYSHERELGFITHNPQTIAQLQQRYDLAIFSRRGKSNYQLNLPIESEIL